jgi:hypothetical protein
VVDRELHPDHHRSTQGGNRDVIPPAGAERDQQRQADHRCLDDGLQPAEGVVLPPDAEG